MMTIGKPGFIRKEGRDLFIVETNYIKEFNCFCSESRVNGYKKSYGHNLEKSEENFVRLNNLRVEDCYFLQFLGEPVTITTVDVESGITLGKALEWAAMTRLGNTVFFWVEDELVEAVVDYRYLTSKGLVTGVSLRGFRGRFHPDKIFSSIAEANEGRNA